MMNRFADHDNKKKKQKAELKKKHQQKENDRNDKIDSILNKMLSVNLDPDDAKSATTPEKAGKLLVNMRNKIDELQETGKYDEKLLIQLKKLTFSNKDDLMFEWERLSGLHGEDYDKIIKKLIQTFT